MRRTLLSALIAVLTIVVLLFVLYQLEMCRIDSMVIGYGDYPPLPKGPR